MPLHALWNLNHLPALDGIPAALPASRVALLLWHLCMSWPRATRRCCNHLAATNLPLRGLLPLPHPLSNFNNRRARSLPSSDRTVIRLVLQTHARVSVQAMRTAKHTARHAMSITLVANSIATMLPKTACAPTATPAMLYPSSKTASRWPRLGTPSSTCTR